MPSASPDVTSHPSPRDTRLRGRTAVVTGASRGIGRALSIALARGGAVVIAGARTAAELEDVAADAGAASGAIHGRELDVADPGSVERFAADVTGSFPVDILVNNAGVGAFGPVEELSLEDWNRVFDVNVRGTFLVTKAFLPAIRARAGQIVNVTSDVSARTFANGSCYTASKHAQRAFTRALQMEVEGDGVRVTEVRPGRVATFFGGSEPPPVDDDFLAPEDVADAIVYALTRPERVRMDEIHFHPRGQEAEF